MDTTNPNRTMFLLAAAAVIRAEGAWAPCERPEDLRVSFGGDSSEYAVSWVHPAGCSARHWLVRELDRVDAHGYVVGVDLTVREVS